MVDAALWGLIQGLTEFLPVSSSGHLVLVPEVLGREGPDLATSAVLHLGTLAAVLAYFRREAGEVLRFTASGRRLLRLLLIGTIPAALVGITLRSEFGKINDTPWAVAVALFLAGVALLLAARLQQGTRRFRTSPARTRP